MALHIRDPETDAAVRALAKRTGLGLTEAVRLAVTEKLAGMGEAGGVAKRPLLERIAPIQERIAAHPDTGLPADKAFYDALSGDA
jgi:antitoxin VapB